MFRASNRSKPIWTRVSRRLPRAAPIVSGDGKGVGPVQGVGCVRFRAWGRRITRPRICWMAVEDCISRTVAST